MKLNRLRQFLPLNSLLGRFVFASLLLLPLFIFLSGLLISNAFQHSQIRAEYEKLQTQLYLLLSLTEVDNKKVILPFALTEPRFNVQNSGLYGFIYDANGNEQWRSSSSVLLSQPLFNKTNNFNIGNQHQEHLFLDDNQSLYTFSYDIEWLDDNNNTLPLRFVIANSNQALDVELKAYQKRLWQWLGLMGLLIIAAQIIILKWGLRPLNHLSKELQELQENKVNQLSKTYPVEIQDITKNFNNILISEKQQRERYRNTMADLAHSLKTPLAVIQSQMDENKSINDSVLEQVDRINQIISHQLKRALIRTNQISIITQKEKISVRDMVNRLTKILDKVYKNKNIKFTNLVPNTLAFLGDEADLLEVMGNLLDNACKYGKDSVTITGLEKKEGNKNIISIYISDNGSGIPQSLHSTILARGSRSDTVQAGQGIGLSVVVDIMSSYGGGLELINDAPEPHLSGACFCISFPTL